MPEPIPVGPRPFSPQQQQEIPRGTRIITPQDLKPKTPPVPEVPEEAPAPAPVPEATPVAETLPIFGVPLPIEPSKDAKKRK